MAVRRVAGWRQHVAACIGLAVGLGIVGWFDVAPRWFPERFGGPNIGGAFFEAIGWLIALAGAGYLVLFYATVIAERRRLRTRARR